MSIFLPDRLLRCNFGLAFPTEETLPYQEFRRYAEASLESTLQFGISTNYPAISILC